MHLGSFLQILLDCDSKSIPIGRIIVFGSIFTKYFGRLKSTWWTALILFANLCGLYVLTSMWSNWNFYTFLIGIQNGRSMETNLAVCCILRYIYIYFLNKCIYLLIYLFLAVLGLRFCARAFFSCGKRGPLIAVRGPLTVVASPVAEHRLQTRRLSSCGSRA